MEIFKDSNQNHGATLFLVTHDPNVARSTDCIVHLLEGKVIWDEFVMESYLQALREYKVSRLG